MAGSPSGQQAARGAMPLGVPNTRGAGGSTPGPSHPLGTRDGPRSVGEDAPELLHDLLLTVRLRDRELLHEEVASGIEHLPLAEGELLVPLQHEEIAQHLGDLEHTAGLDLLGVLPVAAVPGLLIDLDLLVAQDPVDLGDHVLADDAAQPNRLHVLLRDHDGHVDAAAAPSVDIALPAEDDLALDHLDDADAMRRVDDLLTNLERTHHSGASDPRTDDPF